jgi:tRNA dimethylallyltransferase
VTLAVLAGPTGSGKSELAMRLALASGGEIVNYDSMQIYRGFDIGTAKPSEADRRAVPHHLFDIVDAAEEFNAADYARRAREICEDIASRGKTAILAGGTFFYLRALLSGLPAMPGRDESVRERLRRIADTPQGPSRLHRWLSRVDPKSASRIPPPDRHRVERALEVWIVSGKPISSWERPGSETVPELASLKIGVQLDRAILVERLDARVEEMYRTGLVDETAALLERHPRTARPFTAIGYKEAAAVVAGEIDRSAAILETKRRTRAYAKRQMTWLRSERNVHWVDGAEREQTFAAALRLLREVRG